MQELSETQAYQAILSDLDWLNKTVKHEPSEFANDHLARLARELTELVDRVADGEV